jgi:AcrR family transcriptional regulator
VTANRIASLYEAFLRKAPRHARSRAMVEAMLTAALEHLTREGSEDRVVIQGVADRAGVGIGSLYDYFGDRRSLMAAVAAKVTEDNRAAFEAVLARTASDSRAEGVARIVEFWLGRFTADKRGPRAVLRIAHAIGLMPTVAASTDVAAEALARALRLRTDINVPDVDVAAWVMTHTMMGVAHTLIWQDAPRCEVQAIRAELGALFSAYLAGESRAPAR